MLVYESANETRSSKSAIFSPTYAGDYLNNSCLSIMFKQNGYNMGTFNVFIVPENDEYLNQPLLTFKGNKGPQWNLWTVTLKDQTHVQGPFQIVYQKMSWRSDFYAYFFYAGTRGHKREFLSEQHLHQIYRNFDRRC